MINLILQKYIENNTGITLISILRDELLLLPYFIDYYKKLNLIKEINGLGTISEISERIFTGIN